MTKIIDKKTMNYQIKQTTLSPEIKSRIFQGFSNYSVKETGIDGMGGDITFEAYIDDDFIGAVVAELFWGQLYIKYLFVEETYRNQGIGKHLMEHAHTFGKNNGCTFAFVQTLNFQAPEFYKKLGYQIDFVRHGYAKGASFYYLKKDL